MTDAACVRAIVERYLEHGKIIDLWTAESLEERKRTLAAFVAHCGDMPVADCRPFHLTDWIEEHSRWKSTSTRKAKANQINAVFNWAARESRIGRNPFAGVTYAEADPRPCLPDATLEEITLRANKRYERAVLFLRATGRRLSELCRAAWPDIDLEKNVWTIWRHKSKSKTRKAQWPTLTPEALAVLADVRREQGPDYQGIIFLNNRGKPWTRRTLGQHLRRMKARFSIQTPATLHGLRHQLGTVCIKNGAALKLVSVQLGHASTAITERYYCSITKDDADVIRAATMLGMPKK